jgi:hypothetical protein
MHTWTRCIASTAITLDILESFGLEGHPWEVCLRLLRWPHHLEIGCYPVESDDGIGGHLVVLVDGFLVDPSFGQITDANPNVQVPPVFVGALLPPGAPLQSRYHFSTPFAELQYYARPMSKDFRTSLDWGPSAERDAANAAILNCIHAYCQAHGLASFSI